MRFVSILTCLLATPITGLSAPAPTNALQGLILRIASKRDTKTDTMTASAVALYVAEGQPPSVMVPAGPFSATWEGQILGELRSEFAFQVEANGLFQLFINGHKTLDLKGLEKSFSLSQPVQINKGSNALKAIFESPMTGEAYVRLTWTEKGTNTIPIPPAAFAHRVTPELQEHNEFRLGREVFLQHRCAKCHQDVKGNVPELAMDAPSFEGIGARRTFTWMKDWILDPHAHRTNAQMPRMFRGPEAGNLATAAAAFLATLRDEAPLQAGVATAKPKDVESQKGEAQNLYEVFHCGACHSNPGTTEPGKISLDQVRRKFLPGKLAEFLMAPEAHYKWIEMPNFKLTSEEASQLADNLLKAAPAETKASQPDPALAVKGKEVVQTTGCLNCHTLNLENRFTAPGLSKIAQDRWKQGCLAAEQGVQSRAPDFEFTAEQKAALRHFGADKPGSLQRHVPYEFATRQTRALNCTGCHGQFEGFPALDILGGKLKPEWAARFIAGQIGYKPRAEKHPRGEPWLPARMPAFASRAQYLAEGRAALHGYPPKSPAEPPPDKELAEIGRKLVGKDGGFSCISCHGTGQQEALEVFESEGINLGYSAERLLPDYYRRWMRNPLLIDSQTKMPVYFEDGHSPLTEVLDGNAEKQITAIWHYLQAGMKMEPPAGQ